MKMLACAAITSTDGDRLFLGDFLLRASPVGRPGSALRALTIFGYRVIAAVDLFAARSSLPDPTRNEPGPRIERQGFHGRFKRHFRGSFKMCRLVVDPYSRELASYQE